MIWRFENMEIRSVIQCASYIDTRCFRTYLICGNELKFTKTVVTWYGSLRSACESTENSGGIKSSRNRMESTQNHFYRCNEWFSATGALRMLCRGLSQKLRKAMDGSESRFLRNQVDLRTSISTRIRGFRVDQRGDSYSKNYVGAVNTWSDRNRSTSWIGVTVTRECISITKNVYRRDFCG